MEGSLGATADAGTLYILVVPLIPSTYVSARALVWEFGSIFPD